MTTIRTRALRSILLVALAAAPATADEPAAGEGWRTLGLMRIRDMTPFGINRLDLLPAHTVELPPGSFAFEVSLTHQNTWVLSRNVEEYLASRGDGRRAISAEDVAAILALPGDVYLVDGEFGLLDLTLHFRPTEHFGLYATIPYHFFGGGRLDSTIESFHREAGFSSAERDRVPRNDWLVVARVDGASLLLTEPPDNDLGDPVLGARWSAAGVPERWNLIVEGAAKLAWFDRERLVSTGSNDYGVQLSLQRFLRRNALYLTFSYVYVSTPDRAFSDDRWLPTLVAGWETRLTRSTNLILQLYGSPSTIQETALDELSADKLQATIGLQWLWRDGAVRFGITENLANFNNTPDVGVTLSYGRALRGGR